MHHDPPVDHGRHPLPPPERDRCFWPEGAKLPGFYYKTRRQMVPCPGCRRLLTDDGGQAAICTSSGRLIVWFRCRCCDHRWQLPVKEV